MVNRKTNLTMGSSCEMCPICNGIACRGRIPGMGSAGSGSVFVNNYKKLQKVKLNLKVMHTYSQPDSKTTLLGFSLSFPVIGAPIASVELNMGGEISEDTYIDAFIRGCDDAGIIGTTGDGLKDFVYKAGFKAIKGVNGNAIPFIKPWPDQEFFRKMNDALISGAKVIGIDIDAIGLTILKKIGKPTKMRTHQELKTLIERIPLPVVLKGIMTPEEAEVAIACGASAIVVSNHGGRTSDACPSTVEVLPSIARQVKKRIPILVDGGIRSGEDIIKMIALGADAVMIGRPIAISIFRDTENGVKNYLDNLNDQFIKAMILTGCHTIDEINENIIYQAKK